MSLKITPNRRYSNRKNRKPIKASKSAKSLRKHSGGPRLKKQKILALEQYGIRLPIGPELNHLRTSLGLSMSEITRRTGISHSIISELESGNVIDPSGSVIALLCKLFNVSIDKFYNGEHHESK